MHIAEGVLSPPVLAAGAAVTAVGLYLGVKNMRENQIPLCGAMAAAFFLASLIHVPIGISSAHLLLTGLTGIILGWSAIPAIFTGLCLQALLFQYGGITTLGVNTACMGGAAICSWYLFKIARHAPPASALFKTGAFCTGALGVGISALFTACALSFTSESFKGAAMALLLAHLPIMIVEGLVSMLTIGFLARFRPEIIHIPYSHQQDTKQCPEKK